MRKSNLLFFVCFCFSLLSCDPSARDGIITGYTITCSPQKETYTLGDKIKITVDYGALKNSYRNLFIEIDGWEFLTETSYLLSDGNIIVHDDASDKNIVNTTVFWDFDSYQKATSMQTFTVTVKKAGKYKVDFSLEADCREKEITGTAFESYTFLFADNQ